MEDWKHSNEGALGLCREYLPRLRMTTPVWKPTKWWIAGWQLGWSEQGTSCPALN